MNGLIVWQVDYFFGMTVTVFFYALAYILLKKRYSMKSLYYAGIPILVGFIIPYRPALQVPDLFWNDDIAMRENHGVLFLNLFSDEKSLSQTTGTLPSPGVPWNLQESSFLSSVWPEILENKMLLFLLLWLSVFAIIMLYHGITYLSFTKRVKRWSRKITDPSLRAMWENEKRRFGITSETKISLKVCSCINTPMLLGIVYPTVLLPENFLTDETERKQIKFVLRHELVHFKRKDTIAKQAMLLAAAINWFHPAVYLFIGVFDRLCELSCDEIAVKNTNVEEKYQYAVTLLQTAAAKRRGNAGFPVFWKGGKDNMKRRLAVIMDVSRKKTGGIVIGLCVMFTLCSGVAVAAPDTEKTVEGSIQQVTYDAEMLTTEQMEKEIEESFKEVFSNEFRESDFPGMIITYDEEGIPIVTDPNGIYRRGVIATTKYEKNGFYSSSSCSADSLVFYILKGQEVEVIDSSYTKTAAKVKYAGSTGYMKKTDLKF